MNKRQFWGFLVLLPIALLVILWQQAELRPHLVALPFKNTADANPVELGRLLDFSDRYAFFWRPILFDDIESDDLGNEKALQPIPFGVLTFGGDLQNTKIYSPLAWVTQILFQKIT